MARLAIAGYRGFTDYVLFSKEVKKCLAEIGEVETFVSGGAKGTDKMAERYASETGIPIVIYKPDWDGRGRGAGLERNTDIVTDSTHLLAFLSPRSKGTPDTIRKAHNKGIPVKVIDV